MTAEIPGLVVRYRKRRPTGFDFMSYGGRGSHVQWIVERYLKGAIDDAELENDLDWAFGIEPVKETA